MIFQTNAVAQIVKFKKFKQQNLKTLLSAKEKLKERATVRK